VTFSLQLLREAGIAVAECAIITKYVLSIHCKMQTPCHDMTSTASERPAGSELQASNEFHERGKFSSPTWQGSKRPRGGSHVW